MLTTIDIPPTVGRVCYLDSTGKAPTVECYSNKTAFKFMLKENESLSIGDWVRISGQVRIGKTRNKKTGLIDGIRSYYHEPFDGTNRDNWTYLELIDPIQTNMGPIYLSTILSEVIDKAKAHVKDWSHNQDKDTILSTINSFQKALDALHKAFRQIMRDEEDKNAKSVKFPEISSVDL